MIVAAITGSIGCGKTTLAKIVLEMGYPVFDADRWVRRIYNNKDFLSELNRVFEGIVCNGVADKRKLRSIVAKNQINNWASTKTNGEFDTSLFEK